jgi:membrane-associated PAP2 superfamily phosphatase
MRLRLCRLWWSEVRWPLLAFAPVAALCASTRADIWVARTIFFDASRGTWIGSHNWWVECVLHTGGRWSIRCIVVAAVALWAASLATRRLEAWRRTIEYFILAIVLGVGIVGLLKTITNVDCPWDLAPFGGDFPVISLFADRPDGLRAGHCFPAAHARSGYALMALYFALCERSRQLARAGLMVGILCGLLFGIAQQSRGAHFISHDAWSAFLVWVVAASVYVFGFRARLHVVGLAGFADGRQSGLHNNRCSTRFSHSGCGVPDVLGQRAICRAVLESTSQRCLGRVARFGIRVHLQHEHGSAGAARRCRAAGYIRDRAGT